MKRFLRFIRIVRSPKRFQYCIIPGLDTHADPVDPSLFEQGCFVRRHSCRIHFDGPFLNMTQV